MLIVHVYDGIFSNSLVCVVDADNPVLHSFLSNLN